MTRALSDRNRTLWAESVEMPIRPRLTQNAEADVCIVGAGIAGLTTAYLLAQAHMNMVILDDGPRTSAASSSGTRARRRGTARATARASIAWAR